MKDMLKDIMKIVGMSVIVGGFSYRLISTIIPNDCDKTKESLNDFDLKTDSELMNEMWWDEMPVSSDDITSDYVTVHVIEEITEIYEETIIEVIEVIVKEKRVTWWDGKFE